MACSAKHDSASLSPPAEASHMHAALYGCSGIDAAAMPHGLQHHTETPRDISQADTGPIVDSETTERIEQAKDPFHSLPTELLVPILDRVSARQRCYLRLQNRHIRQLVENYEEARSINSYVRDGLRAGEPWNSLPGYARIDLRARLTSLASYLESVPSTLDHRSVLDAVAKRLNDLRLEPILARQAPIPESIFDAILELQHTQRLLSDQEQRGQALDDKLVCAQRSLQSRLVDICGLHRQLTWPTDMTTRS